MTRLAKLLGIASVTTLLLAPAAAAQDIVTSTQLDVVVVDHPAALLAVDPTGVELWLWRLDALDDIVGAVAAGGLVYVSTAAADGSGTDVYAAPAAAEDLQIIGRLPGRALVKAVAADGSQLLLVELPAPDSDGRIGSPTGVARLTLPERWRPAASTSLAQRDVAFGPLASDGQRWYELRLKEATNVHATELELALLDFSAGEPTTAVILPLPDVSGSHSLLLAPDGDALYLVDYIAQTILVIEPAQPAIVGSVPFGQFRYKRPLCAAALSPHGDRLYVLGNSGAANAGDGVLVYETTTWRLVEHHLPGRDFYCLAVSPDGERLYATEATTYSVPLPATDPQLVTIDSATGRELSNVSLNLGDCCAFLVAAAGTTEVVTGDSS